MIIQLLSMFECYLALAQKLDIPVIGISTARVRRLAELAVGNPFNPAVLRQEDCEFSQQWTFVDRLHNLHKVLEFDFFHHLTASSSLNAIYRQYYGSDFQLQKKISLLFINDIASFHSRPLVPNSIEIGGIHLNPVNLLSQVSAYLHSIVYLLHSILEVGRSVYLKL